MIDEFDKTSLNNFINSLTIDNLRIFFTSKSFEKECDLTEPVYSTKYKIEQLSEKLIQNYQNPTQFKELDYPPEN